MNVSFQSLFQGIVIQPATCLGLDSFPVSPAFKQFASKLPGSPGFAAVRLDPVQPALEPISFKFLVPMVLLLTVWQPPRAAGWRWGVRIPGAPTDHPQNAQCDLSGSRLSRSIHQCSPIACISERLKGVRGMLLLARKVVAACN